MTQRSPIDHGEQIGAQRDHHCGGDAQQRGPAAVDEPRGRRHERARQRELEQEGDRYRDPRAVQRRQRRRQHERRSEAREAADRAGHERRGDRRGERRRQHVDTVDHRPRSRLRPCISPAS
jgi:hypothetical protein